MRRQSLRGLLTVALALCLPAGACSFLSGCSSSSSSSNKNQNTGNGGNVQAISVSTGVVARVGSIDSAFTSVTVCVPGSTSQCQTVSGILIDTGSIGLRILASALTVSLPQQKDSSGNPIAECAQFVDGETWGPVQTADITMAGETASSTPIQVVGSSSFATVPASCSNLGPVETDAASLGANGILGVGLFQQDCGSGCTVSGAGNVGFYYTCPSSGCQITTEALSEQVTNPVVLFATDNNGVIIELPSVSSPEVSASGSMIFGIGTQSNNGLGSATVYTLDPATGNFSTRLNGTTYLNAAFIDSGSNATYLLDSATLGIPTCTDFKFWYCPSSTQNLSATNIGANGASGTVDFSIGNADSLVANASDGVAPNLAGPNPGTIDWGLPFFFGRKVFVAIEGRNTPGGTGPLVAY